jgi:hypothetical protein
MIIAFAIMIMIEVPGLIKKKYWRELVVFSVLITVTFAVSLLQMLNIEIPNPVRDTQYFVKNLLHLGYD